MTNSEQDDYELLTTFSNNNFQENKEKSDDSVPQQSISNNGDNAQDPALLDSFKNPGFIGKPHNDPQKESSSLKPGDYLVGQKYKLEKKLGSGAMGVAWLVHEIVDGERIRDIVIKIVSSEVQNDQTTMDEVQKSFNLIKELSGQGICPVYGLNKDSKYGWLLLMQYANGHSLREEMNDHRDKKFTLSETITILKNIAIGLDRAHQMRILHRDVKPENIIFHTTRAMIREALLIDFGLADKIHSTQSRLSGPLNKINGTPLYMSPEQWTNDKLDSGTDQFALGIIAYEMLAGRHPFEDNSYGSIRNQVINNEACDINDYPYSLNVTLKKAMAKQRADRFPSCLQFIEALEKQEDLCSNKTPTFEPIFPLPASSSNLKFNKTVFEKAENWEKRLANYGRIEIGLAEFILDESDADNDFFPVRFSVRHEFLEKLTNFPKRIDLNISAELAQEIHSNTPQIPLTATLTVQNSNWQLKEFFLENGNQPINISDKIQQQEKDSKIQEEENESIHKNNEQAGVQKSYNINGIEYIFHWCPPGKFMMGSPESEEAHDYNELLHNVILSHGFWTLETEVTQEMWQSIMGNNPSQFQGKSLPVETVSWDDCQKFCEKISTLSGLPIRLPTEAEWEYACRAGTTTPFNFGSELNGNLANCNGSKPYGMEKKGKNLERTSQVKSYPPNAWGLYDMHGNVWEWCEDLYNDSFYSNCPTIDPVNRRKGASRVYRGGSWYFIARFCRSAYRYSYSASFRSPYLGFRIVFSNPED